MPNNKEFLIELIFNKLKYNSCRKINLDQKEFVRFINFLINDNKS